MANRLRVLHFVVIFLFALAYLVQQLGSAGRLRDTFAQRRLYPPLRRIESIFTDLKFRIRGPRPATNKTVVVEIDSDSIAALGRWPWRRDFLAYLIEKIFAGGARAVGVDLLFTEAEQRIPEELVTLLQQRGMGGLLSQFDSDSVLAKVIRKHADNLVLSWATETDCRPQYLAERDCPVTDPRLINMLPKELTKFTYPDFHLATGFDPLRTTIPSAPTILSNLPLFNAASVHQGFANSFPDGDGAVRRAGMVMMVAGRPYPSMPLELARVALGETLSVDVDASGRVKRLGFERSHRDLPINGAGAIGIDFYGPARSLSYISAADVLREDESPVRGGRGLAAQSASHTALLKDAVVLIGISALALGDIRATPFDSHVPGVEIQANIVDNLISGRLVKGGATGWPLWTIFLLVTVGAWFFQSLAGKWNAKPMIGLFAGTLFVICFLDVRLFANDHNWDFSLVYLELTALAFLTIASRYVQEEQKKKFLRVAFSKYVAPAIVETLLKDPAQLSLGGTKKKLTSLFSDIRGFTTISEAMDPRLLSEFLNDYFGLMTDIVLQYGGTFDKYVGDALVAFWGAPLDDSAQQARACAAAKEMLLMVDRHHGRFRERFGFDLRIGVGVHAGTASVGNMGSEKNWGYTAIGDDINLAARLESTTKEYRVGALTSRATFDAILAQGQPLPAHRVLDDVRVKGRQQPVQIIEITKGELDAEGLRLFEEGRQLYLSGQWQRATDLFQAAEKRLGTEDGPCRVFADRCAWFSIEGPRPSWDGCWEL